MAFLRVQERKAKDGTTHYYASVMRGERVRGKVVQTVVARIGRVEEDQIPYLKAAFAKRRPRLVWDEEEAASDEETGD